MATTTWQTQTKDKPLFPDLLWARPERQDQSGSLLIIGGSTHGFASVVRAMEAAKATGIGEVKAILPRGLEKHLGHSEELLYGAQTATGSFGQTAIDEVSGYLGWAKAVLLPGDLTRNAETTIFAESVVQAARIPIVITGEALDVLQSSLKPPLEAPLVAVADFRQLQQFVQANPLAEALLPRSTLEQRVRLLQSLVERTALDVIVLHDQGQYLVVEKGQANITHADMDRLEFAARAAVLSAQFPAKLYEAVTTTTVC